MHQPLLVGALRVRLVHSSLLGFAERPVLAVANDPDDLDRACSAFGPEGNAPADRRSASEITPDEFLVDDDSRGSTLAIRRGEFTSGNEDDSHRFEIGRSDGIPLELRPDLADSVDRQVDT